MSREFEKQNSEQGQSGRVKNTIETMLDTEEGRETLRKMEELRQSLQSKKL